MRQLKYFRAALWLAAILVLMSISGSATAQCYLNPTGETSVGLKNASSYFLTFYIDGVNKGGVPSGDRSVDFVVRPGEHILLAKATVGAETISASRTVTVTVGYVCTWTVTDPPKVPEKAQTSFQDSLVHNPLSVFVTLTIPNQ